MDENTRKKVSSVCLRGRPVPRSLELLWDLDEERAELFGITRMLTNLDVLEDGYGEALMKESEDVAANVRAHRKVFEALGFFAELDGGELLAYWLEPKADEPPIVKLDTEGSYDWLGPDAREALLRLASEQDGEDEAREWLEGVELDPGELGEDGVTTQWLPSLEKRKTALYYQYLGTPKATGPNPIPFDPREATSWILQPAEKVRDAMVALTGGPLTEFCIWTDGDGNATSIALKEGLDDKATALGIKKPSTKSAVVAALGKPDAEGKDFVSFLRGPVRTNFRFDKNDALKSVNIALVEPE